jgi:hypothetical protein
MDKNSENTEEIQKIDKRKSMPQIFKKGQSGNPKGKPKGALNEVTKFKKAIELFEREQGKDIYKIILEKANRYPQVLIAIFKALIPQQTESNVNIKHESPYANLSDQELIEKANDIINRARSQPIRRDINRA